MGDYIRRERRQGVEVMSWARLVWSPPVPAPPNIKCLHRYTDTQTHTDTHTHTHTHTQTHTHAQIQIQSRSHLTLTRPFHTAILPLLFLLSVLPAPHHPRDVERTRPQTQQLELTLHPSRDDPSRYGSHSTTMACHTPAHLFDGFLFLPPPSSLTRTFTQPVWKCLLCTLTSPLPWCCFTSPSCLE